MNPWIRPIARFTGEDRLAMVSVLGLLFLNAVVAAATPWPITIVVDTVLGGAEPPELLAWVTELPGADSGQALAIWMAAATIAIYLLGQVLTVVQGAIEVAAGQRMTYRIGGAVFDRIHQLPLVRYALWPVGDLMRRVKDDASCGRDLIFQIVTPALASIVTLIVTSVVMITLEPVLWLVAVLAAVPGAAAAPFGSAPLMRLERRNAEVDAERAGLVEQALTALPSVQALGAEPIIEHRFAEQAEELVGIRRRIAVAEGVFGVVVDAIFALSSAFYLLVGGWMVIDGRLSVGELLVFLAYRESLHAPLQTLTHLATAYAGAAVKAERVLEVLQSPPLEERPDADDLVLRQTSGARVDLEHVTFGYEYGHPVLVDVSLTVQPGEMVAIAGPTGTGKSTLISLIPRLFDPWSGSVRIDHQDVRSLTVSSLRAGIAVVLQEPFLFPVSVAENIAYGHPASTEAEIVNAASAAGALDFIRRLPDGFHTVIGERGATLSGGEKQRIAIARALVRDAPIIILDEPTSALDGETEEAVMDAIDVLSRGRTTLLIAHRETTIARADRVFDVVGRTVRERTMW